MNAHLDVDSLKMWSNSVDKSDFGFWEQNFFGEKNSINFQSGHINADAPGRF